MYSASNQWIINSKLIRTNSVQIFYRYDQNLIQFALSYRKTDLVVIQDKVKAQWTIMDPIQFSGIFHSHFFPSRQFFKTLGLPNLEYLIFMQFTGSTRNRYFTRKILHELKTYSTRNLKTNWKWPHPKREAASSKIRMRNWLQTRNP